MFSPYCALPPNAIDLHQPPALIQSVAAASSSVVLADIPVLTCLDRSWSDSAPLQLVPRHQVNVQIRAVRPMEFSGTGNDGE